MNWVYLPIWSVRVIALLAAVLLLMAAVRWWRERRGGALLGLRAATLVTLVLVMLNPHAILPREQAGKPKLIVLLDASASMATRDVGAKSRFAAALNELSQAGTWTALNKEFDLDCRAFDTEVRAVDLTRLNSADPAGQASELGKSLMSVVTELGQVKHQAGVLLVSDGRDTGSDTLEAAQLALARSVPLWTCSLGGAISRHDLWIETASSEALAFSGAEVELSATLHQAGYPNRSFKVEILTDNRLVDTREVLPGTNGSARVSLKVKAPQTGEQRYLFRVPAQPEEADTANNEHAVFLRCVGEKVRLLVAEAQPHWDTKFLVQSLKQNPYVDLTAVYRLNANRHLTIVSSLGNEARVEQDFFPRTAAAMNGFDVIILGRGAEAFVDASTGDLLADFVARRGGSLIFARGKPYGGRVEALSRLEPVAWGSGVVGATRMKPTDAGRDNPIFDLGSSGTLEELLDRMPALDRVAVTLGEKPLAVVLAGSADPQGPVLLAYERYGQGKTMSLNASGLWRWAFRETGQQESELAYARFWVSLLQWLLSGNQFLPGADVSLSSSRRYFASDQPMQFLVATRNLDRSVYQPRLVISGSTGQVEVEPRPRGDVFVAEAGPFPPGSWQVTLRNNIGKPSELSQSVEVVSSSVEKRELSSDPALMRRLAETSGGAVIAPGQINRLPDTVRRWESARQIAHRQQSAWDRWWLLAGMIGLLSLEWWLRRREGLL